jgi:phage replication O-like protein O
MAKNTSQQTTYKGYSSPNYTPVPDELFDEQLPDLSGSELKVLLYIIRRTFGFKKDSDNISLNQLLHGITTKEGEVLDRRTGLTKKTLLEAIKSLVEKNLIITERRRSKEKGDEPTTYRLNLISHPRETRDTPVV